MITELLLILIAAVAVGGMYYAFKLDNEEKRKKVVTIVVVVIMAMSVTLLAFNDRTRDIETGQDAMITTLQQLLGYTAGGGYNPYLYETWGGIEPLQDFDYDGISNINDHDIDNDGVPDVYEQQTKYNPMAPDAGIKDLDVLFLDSETIQLKVVPTFTSGGAQAVLNVYIDDHPEPLKRINNFQNSQYGVDVIFKYDSSTSHKLELTVTGSESRYANKANNVLSYTIPSSTNFVIGKWYSDIESQIQGVIRNTKFLPGTVPLFSLGEDLLRDFLAGVPPWMWIVLALAVVGSIYYYSKYKKMKKMKQTFMAKKKQGRIRKALSKLNFLKKENREPHGDFMPGDVNIKMYRGKK